MSTELNVSRIMNADIKAQQQEQQDKELATQGKQAQDLVVQAAELRITNQAQYEYAAGLGKSLRDVRDAIIEYWDGTKEKPGPVKKAFDAWKSLTTKRAEMVQPVDAAIARVSSAVIDYDQEQERQRREQQRLADEQARKNREAEIAEQVEAAKAEGAKKRELEQMQKALEAEPVQAPTVAIEQKPEGLSIPKVWRCRETDHAAFMAHVVKLLISKNQAERMQGCALALCLEFNSSKANRLATAWGNTAAVPGLVFEQVPGVRYR